MAITAHRILFGVIIIFGEDREGNFKISFSFFELTALNSF